MHEAVGRTQSRTDVMDPARAEAMAATLGVPRPNGPLPPFFHLAYFWEALTPEDLGRDGHPALGDGFVPDLGLPRRMWAGGRLRWQHPLLTGVPAEKHSEIISIDLKDGRSGRLAFVTIRHRIQQSDHLCVEEEQDLVYREDPDDGASPPAAKPAPDDKDPQALVSDPVLLFRYSAITLNGHRIHYDADYARAIEGYLGLVVHGPLIAQRLMLRAEQSGPLRSFAFRGARPLCLGESAVTCQDGNRLWVRNGKDQLVMTAEVEWT